MDIGHYIYVVLWVVFSGLAVFQILSKRRRPSSALSWILFVILVPIFGALVFYVLGPQRIERFAKRRSREIDADFQRQKTDERWDHNHEDGLKRIPLKEDIPIFRLASSLSHYPTTKGNMVEFLADPEVAFEQMQDAILQAREFIHLEYYIISSDEVTFRLFDCLEAALDRGVEVRILYDALGSLFLKRRHFQHLIDKGAKIAGFVSVSSRSRRLHLNFRNHRKLLVVDGTTVFTGGTNIGKEYLGRRDKNQWRDNTVRVRGPVCIALHDVFIRDWHFTTGEDLFKDKYYPTQKTAGDTFLQVLESGPDSDFSALYQALFMALNAAKSEILLATPYFVPDSSMMSSLISAALRGVRVTLLVPQKSDALVVLFASRSYFEELLKAGVRIFEYQPSILHAKLMTIDNRWTMLGSANMDIRSFRLNFELNILAHGADLAAQAEKLIERDLKQSREIRLESFVRRPLYRRMAENFCSLFAPIL